MKMQSYGLMKCCAVLLAAVMMLMCSFTATGSHS